MCNICQCVFVKQTDIVTCECGLIQRLTLRYESGNFSRNFLRMNL